MSTLDEVRAIIDGEMNCSTPEYRAMNLLHCAVEELAFEIHKLQSELGHLQADLAEARKEQS